MDEIAVARLADVPDGDYRVFAVDALEVGMGELAEALAAAVAIALGKLTGSNIVDDNEFWNSKYEQAPDDFLESVRVKEKSEDIENAVGQFTRQMNKR